MPSLNSLPPSNSTLQPWEPSHCITEIPKRSQLCNVHVSCLLPMLCVNVQALRRGSPACCVPTERLGDFSIMLPCRHFLGNQPASPGGDSASSPRCDPSLSRHPMPFAQQPCVSLLHRAAGYLLPHLLPSLKPSLGGQPSYHQKCLCPFQGNASRLSQADTDPQTGSHGHRTQNPAANTSSAAN